MKHFANFLILSLLLSSCAILYPSTKRTNKKSLKHGPFDAIIVPGVPHNGIKWDGIMQIRVHWSKYLYDNGYAKNIIYSGGAVYTPYIEAKAMALYGEALGIPAEHIFVDARAEHSTENIYYSYLIAKEQGFKKIALATDPFQTNNMRFFIRKYRLLVKLLPIIIDTIARMDRYEPKIDVSLAKVENFNSIVNTQTKKERLKGTLGRRIEWCEEDLKRRYRRRYKDRVIKCN